MKKFLRPYLAFLMMGSLLVATACSDDDNPDPVDNRETITTLNLEMVPEGKGQLVTAFFKDLDGPGGNPATKTSLITLAPNTTYKVNLTLLNESGATPEDITAVVRAEKDDHQVFYVASSSLGWNVTVNDKDSKSRPLGLDATIVTGNPGTGTLQLVLKHQPGTKAAAPGDITKGETDIEVTFNVAVQQ
jgi:hypothetical protein